MASALKESTNPWVLSYDDCEEIRKLYEWAGIDKVSVSYSITATKDKESGKRSSRAKEELIIYSKG